MGDVLAMDPNVRHPRSCSCWFASDATTGEGICDCGLASETTVEGLYQHDLGALLRAAGLGDYARSESPHMVVHDLLIPRIKQTRQVALNLAAERAADRMGRAIG